MRFLLDQDVYALTARFFSPTWTEHPVLSSYVPEWEVEKRRRESERHKRELELAKQRQEQEHVRRQAETQRQAKISEIEAGGPLAQIRAVWESWPESATFYPQSWAHLPDSILRSLPEALVQGALAKFSTSHD
ncbi:MAG: hypothetical protein AAB466_02990 [Verrucomicrobiota bacterium]